MSQFARTGLLLALAVVVVVCAVHGYSAPVKENLSLQNLMTALGGMFIIVLLIERVTEIVISIWRQSWADATKAELEQLGKADGEADGPGLAQKAQALARYQAETKGLALLVGFTIAVVVCSAGVGLLSEVVAAKGANTEFLRGVDIILTAGLLAGGSDAFHQFASTLETFFTESKKQMTNK